MDHIEAFLRADHAGEILLVLGALLVLVGAWRIVRSGLALAFWMLLCALGAVSVSYGMQRTPLDLPALPGETMTIADRVDAGKALSADVLRVLCERLEDYGAGGG